MNTLRSQLQYQFDFIWNADWKYLIILDACRYDYFERVYKEFPDLVYRGKLIKVISSGSHTIEWFRKTFKDCKCNDIVYISANPYINSKGLHTQSVGSRFFKIIDVWDWGWNKEAGIVYPREVNKALLVSTRLYRDKKFIIHYIQPHAPYIGFDEKPIKVKDISFTKKETKVLSLNHRVVGFIRWKFAGRLLGWKGVEIVNNMFGPPPDYTAFFAMEYGLDSLKKAYEHNLRFVLSHVNQVLRFLRGKVIITADHGELLGEHSMFGHFPKIRLPELIEVPWLELVL